MQSAQTNPGADCDSDHKPLIAEFSLKMKKVGKIPRAFSYDLYKIPYYYRVEMTNRFIRLDLIECQKNYEEFWDIVQEAVIKTIHKKKKCKKSKWLS